MGIEIILKNYTFSITKYTFEWQDEEALSANIPYTIATKKPVSLLDPWIIFYKVTKRIRHTL